MNVSTQGKLTIQMWTHSMRIFNLQRVFIEGKWVSVYGPRGGETPILLNNI